MNFLKCQRERNKEGKERLKENREEIEVTFIARRQNFEVEIPVVLFLK